jgi:hypothetical protein
MINALARLGGMQPGELPKSVAATGIAQLFICGPGAAANATDLRWGIA